MERRIEPLVHPSQRYSTELESHIVSAAFEAVEPSVESESDLLFANDVDVATEPACTSAAMAADEDLVANDDGRALFCQARHRETA